MIRVKLDYLIAVAQFLEAAGSRNWERALAMQGSSSLPDFVVACNELGLVVSQSHAAEILLGIAKQQELPEETRKADKERHDRWMVGQFQTLADNLRRELKSKVGFLLTNPISAALFENPRPFDSDNDQRY